MDTTQILYLVGAFILGFIVAWFAGRSGPKRALEESEATAHSLQRTVDDRARTISKLEGQLKEQQAQVQKLGADNSNLAALLKTSEEGLSDAAAEVARLQTDAQSTQGDRLLLESELAHTRDAYASSRTRAAELTATLAETEAAAKAAAIAAAATAMVAPPPDRTDEVEALSAQVETLQREVEVARAATERMSIRAAMRPRLTPGKRAEYVALAENPERLVMALHERDVAVADALTETEYLRRNLSTLTSAGAELATTLERRDREYHLLLNRLSDLTATESGEFATYASSAATRALPMMAPVGEVQRAEEETPAEVVERALAVEIQGELDKRLAELAELKVQVEKLQANLDELQADIEGLSATKGELEAQLEVRDIELNDVKSQLAVLQSDIETAATAKAALEADLQTHGVELDDLLSRITALSGDLETIAGDEDMAVEPPAADVPASEADTATPEVAAPIETDAAGLVAATLTAAIAGDAAAPAETPAAAPTEAPAQAGIAKLAAGITAAVAAFKRKNERIAGFQQQLADLDTEKGSLESGLAEKDQGLTDTQSQLEKLQVDFQDRSVKFDALSLRASSLEADMEITTLQRAKFEDQVKQIAVGLQAAVGSYGDGADQTEAEATTDTEAPTADTTTLSGEVPSAEATVVAAGDASAAPEATAAAAPETVAEPPAAAEAPQPSALELLVTSATAVTAVVSKKSGALTDAKTQLAALQAQIAELTASHEGITAELAAKSESLADFQSQLQAMQSDLGSRTTDLEGTTLKLSALQADHDALQSARAELEGTLQQASDQLASYVAEFGEPEAVPAETPAETAETPVAAEAAIAPAVEATAEVAPETAPATGILAEIAVVGALLKRRKEAVEGANARIGELEGEISALTAQKEELAADLQTQLQSLETDLGSRVADLDDVNLKLWALQGDLDTTVATRDELEGTLLQLGDQLNGYLAEYGEAQPAPSEASPEAAAVTDTLTDTLTDAEAVAPVPPTAAALAGALAVGELLKRHKDSAEGANARIGELEDEIGALTSQKDDLETGLQEKDEEIADAMAQIQALQSDVANRASEVEALNQQISGLQTDLEALNQQIADLQTEMDEVKSAKAQLESDLADRDEEIQVLDQKMADLQAKLNESESARLALEAELEGLNKDLEELGAAFDADDDDSVQRFTQRFAGQALAPEGEIAPEAETEAAEGETAEQAQLVRPAVKVAGVAAVASAIEKKQMALKDTEAQRAALQEQLNVTTADRDALQAQLQERDSELTEVQTKLEETPVAPAPKTVSDFKEAARATAATLGIETKTTAGLQDLADVKYIGSTYEQRLYRAGAGTYWELAHLTNDDLQIILKLTEMQQLAMDFDETRSDARRLAEETDSVGLLWEGQSPDDFEPIQGIGKVFEQRLYSAGIRTYQDLANASEEQLADIVKARKPLEPDFASWIRQAKMFLEIRKG